MVRQMNAAAASIPSPRLFNTPLECGLRMLFLLNACSPNRTDLQRLISYDYLLVHSGDVEAAIGSLHPAVPFRGSEWLVKRDLVRSGLDLMFARELIEKRLEPDGIFYIGSPLTEPFIKLLKTDYADDLRSRAAWVASHFGNLSDSELDRFMTTNVGRWGAEFDRLTALNDLELE
jgi:hypothetical protein